MIFIGYGLVLLGYILFLIAAFKESVLWALGCFLFAPICFVFLVIHWSASKNAFFIQIAGFAILYFSGSYF